MILVLVLLSASLLAMSAYGATGEDWLLIAALLCGSASLWLLCCHKAEKPA